MALELAAILGSTPAIDSSKRLELESSSSNTLNLPKSNPETTELVQLVELDGRKLSHVKIRRKQGLDFMKSKLSSKQYSFLRTFTFKISSFK